MTFPILELDGTATHITVPCTHDFRVGDIVCFYEGVGASLDTAFQASTDPLVA